MSLAAQIKEKGGGGGRLCGASTSQDCLLSMILRMVSLRAWWTKGVAVAFMYCSIRVLARVVALNNVVASSGWREGVRKKKRFIK